MRARRTGQRTGRAASPDLARRLGSLGLLAALTLAAASCSSPSPASHHASAPAHRRRPAATTTTSTTTTTASTTTTTAPPVPSSHVVVGISGSSATIEFTSSDLTGSLDPMTGTFSQGGTVYTFVIGGVHYSGTPTTATASGGLITSVAVSGANAGATVTVTLSAPASHASYGLGHNEVGVSFS